MDKRKTNILIKKLALLAAWISVIVLTILGINAANKHLGNTVLQNIEISISPTQSAFVTQNDIKQIIAREVSVKNTKIKEIKLYEIENSIKQNVFVKHSECHVDMDGNLFIKVEPREALLRVFRHNGESYYVDRNAIKIPLNKNNTAHCLVVNGNIFERYIHGDSIYSMALWQVYKIATHVDNDEFFKDQIDQIFVQANNEFVLVPKVGKHTIILGSANNLEDKLKRLKVFYKEGLNKVGWSKYKQINLKYNNQIICTK
ncbi:MAG: cell division protein FtsQ/DivIB [Bacteroidia bacterium]